MLGLGRHSRPNASRDREINPPISEVRQLLDLFKEVDTRLSARHPCGIVDDWSLQKQ